MDQREFDVEEDLKNILRTRIALTEKVQSLEQRVQDTVRSTRETAMETLDAVHKKSTQWMTATADQFPSFEMLMRRPPIIAGGLMAIGLVAIWMTQRKPHQRSGVYPYYPPRSGGADVLPHEERAGVYPYYSPRAMSAAVMPEGAGTGQTDGESYSISEHESPSSETPRKESGEAGSSSLGLQVSEFIHGLKNELTQERTRVQKATLHIARSFARDMVRFAGRSLVALMEHIVAGGQARSRQDQQSGSYVRRQLGGDLYRPQASTEDGR